MARARPKFFDFHRGLQTKANEDGQAPNEFQEFPNVRVDRGTIAARRGMARVLNTGSLNKALGFTAANTDYLTAAVDPRPWTLGTQWTVEALVNLDSKSSGTLLYVGTTTPTLVIDLSSNKWRVRVWDSAATLTTVTTAADAVTGSATSIQVTRDGATVTVRIDNDVTDTGSMSASLLHRAPAGDLRVGADATPATHIDGVVDYIRAFSVARENHNDRLLRFPDPRSEVVLADYDMNATADWIVKDRSRYEAALQAPSSKEPVEVTALCHQTASVRGMTYYVDGDGKKYALVLAGGQAFHVEV